MERLQIYLSNSISRLSDQFVTKFLTRCGDPLEPCCVITPGAGIKQHMLDRMIARDQIAMGARFFTLHAWLAEMSVRWGVGKELPSSLQLSLLLEAEILRLLQGPEVQELTPLYRHLRGSSQAERVSSLAQKMSALFLRYGTYGEDWIEKWTGKRGWQQVLWRAVFHEDAPWTYPCELLSLLPHTMAPPHLVGFSFLPRAHLRFFAQNGAHLYLFSPCEMFWADLCTERERTWCVQQKRGAQHAWEEVLKERNLLLANLGTYGRRCVDALEEVESLSEECYEYPGEPRSLLQELQSDLLSLQPAASALHSDASIQLHVAPSRSREVEALYDALVSLFDQDSSLTFSDVQILAPSIELYLPHIHAVFGRTPRIPYTIRYVASSPLAGALLDLLSLPQCAFDLPSVLRVLRVEGLQKKFDLTAEDVVQIERWMHEARVRCDVEGGTGSWEAAFHQLLLGLAVHPEQGQSHPIQPLPIVSFEQAPLLGKLMRLIRSLAKDLQGLPEQKRTLPGWISYLRGLIDTYFVVQADPLIEMLPLLAASSDPLGPSLLRTILTQTFPQTCSSSQESIQFSSLHEGNSVDRKVICLLGMDEGSFPRVQPREPLCELADHARYLPSLTDQDRALFLRQLLLAKQTLLLFYCAWNETDHHPQGPSSCIQELLDYLQASPPLSVSHPALPFDPLCFAKDAPTKSFSQPLFLAATQYATTASPRRPAPLIPHFYGEAPPPNARKVEEVSVKELLSFAAHPIAFYLKSVVGIALASRPESWTQREFALSVWDRRHLQREALHTSLDAAVALAEARGAFPRGHFGEVAKRQVKEGVRCAAPSHETLLLSTSCKEQSQWREGLRIVPALCVPLEGAREVHIVGSVGPISSQGLLLLAEDRMQDWVKYWPLILVALCLGCTSRLCFAGCGTSVAIGEQFADPMGLLSAYLQYFEESLSVASALLPNWAEALLTKPPQALDRVIHASLSPPFPDAYVEWLVRRDGPPSALSIHSHHLALAKQFAPLLAHAKR